MAVHEVYEAFGIILAGQDADVRAIEFNLTRDNIPHELVVDCPHSDDEITEILDLDRDPRAATVPTGPVKVHNPPVCGQLIYNCDS
jgi:hypothetical protein